MSQDQFFPSIGKLAEKADGLSEELNTSDGEDKPLEEIESLCMQCGEQASSLSRSSYLPPHPVDPDCRE